MKKNSMGQTVMTCLQFMTLAWIAFTGFPRIFIYATGTYLDKAWVASAYCGAVLIFILLSSWNPVLSKMKLSSVVKCLLVSECYLLLVFAQKHLVLAIVAVAVATVVGVLLHLWIRSQNHDLTQRSFNARIRCIHTANAFLCVAASIIFLVPSLIGFYDEFIDTITIEEFEAIVQEYKDEAIKMRQDEKDVFKEHPDVLRGVASWETLSLEDRVKLVQKIALIEEDHLGIQDLTGVSVVAEKLDENECGHYLNSEKTISINIAHILNSPVENVIATVAHETFHRFEYQTVASLDFSKEDVKNSYFYRDARRWHDNMEHYAIAGIDYELYKEQPLEHDAFQYAEERTQVYLAALAETANETTTQ